MDSDLVYDLRLGVNKLGRLPDNTFQIDHETISSHHCEISWLDDGVIKVRDCDSTNGTFINDQPIKEGKLGTGQILRLGDVEFALDSAEANISVPDLKAGIRTRPATLESGLIPCFNHWDLPAVARCKQCKREYCAQCIHILHRLGGKLMKLCPDCSGEMEPLPNRDDLKRRKKSFFGKIKETLKISRKN